MPRDYRVFLDDILEASRKALSYTAGLSEHQFRHDQKTVEAVYGINSLRHDVHTLVQTFCTLIFLR
jgi:uncharacterized protein with HEPN domain